MKMRLIHIGKILVIVSICLYSSLQSFSQGTDSRGLAGVNKNNLYIGFSIDPVSSKINNEGFSDILKIIKGKAVNLNADAGFFFSDLIGISIGAGYSSFSTQLSLDSSSYKFLTNDSEQEQYEMRIKGKSIVEDQKISLLSIPVCLIFRHNISGKIGFYVKPGLSFNIPLVKKYDGNGTFTYEAYYAEYPVLLRDIPEIGLPSNYYTKVSDELQIKSFNMALIISGGFSYSVNERIHLLLGATLNRSVGNVSTYEKDSGFRLSTEMDVLKSMMEGSSDSGLQSLGISLGVRYFIR